MSANTSARASAWMLLVALLLAWPLPMFGLPGATIPVARFAQLAGALTVLAWVEGTGGMVGLFLALLWGHVLIWTLVLCGVVWLARRFLLERLAPRVRAGCVALVVIGLLAWSILGRPYDTPFHHSHAHASWLELFR